MRTTFATFVAISCLGLAGCSNAPTQPANLDSGIMSSGGPGRTTGNFSNIGTTTGSVTNPAAPRDPGQFTR